MKQLKYLIPLTLLLLFVIQGCKKEDKDNVIGDDVKSYVIPPVDITRTESVELIDSSESSEDTAVFICTTKEYTVDGGFGGEGGFPRFNTNIDVVYPGAMLQGSSLELGTPKKVEVKRTGGNVTWNIYNGKNGSAYVEDFNSYTDVSDAINEIIDTTETFPAEFDLTYRNIYSNSHLAFEMGIKASTPVASIESKFGYSKTQSKNSILLKLHQGYFTVVFDKPNKFEDFIHPSVTQAELDKYIQPDNPATYISSVTYGRTLYMLFESSSSLETMNSEIQASFKKGIAEYDVEASVESLAQLKDLSIRIKAYGGDAFNSLGLITQTSQMTKMFETLVAAGTIGSGKPLQYVVKNVANHEIVAVKNATKYTVPNCRLVIQRQQPPDWAKHWHASGTGVWDRLKDQNGNSGVGAMMHYGQPQEPKFYFFSMDGLRFVKTDGSNISGPFPSYDLGKPEHFNFGDYPFDSTDGINSAANHWFDQKPPSNAQFCVYMTLNSMNGKYFTLKYKDQLVKKYGKSESIVYNFPYNGAGDGLLEAMWNTSPEWDESNNCEKNRAAYWIQGIDQYGSKFAFGDGRSPKPVQEWFTLQPSERIEAGTMYFEANGTNPINIRIHGVSDNGDIIGGRYYTIQSYDGGAWNGWICDLKQEY